MKQPQPVCPRLLQRTQLLDLADVFFSPMQRSQSRKSSATHEPCGADSNKCSSHVFLPCVRCPLRTPRPLTTFELSTVSVVDAAKPTAALSLLTSVSSGHVIPERTAFPRERALPPCARRDHSHRHSTLVLLYARASRLTAQLDTFRTPPR